MVRETRLIAVCLLCALILTACNLPQSPAPTTGPGTVGTVVAQTLVALTQTSPASTQAVQGTPQESPTLGTQATLQASSTQPLPTSTVTLAVTPTNTSTPIPKPGVLEGNILGYPYGSTPALAVVAFNQKNSSFWFLITAPGSTYYSMTDASNNGYVTPGQYQVVAYDSSGRSGGCPSLVTVTSEQTVSCDITNWSGSYRGKPGAVPGP